MQLIKHIPEGSLELGVSGLSVSMGVDRGGVKGGLGGGGLIFPTSQISDTISVGKVKHFLSQFSDISFF